jgi:hypothetical protein
MPGHSIKKCRFCRVVIIRCRCIGPHETEWSACDSCKGMVAAGVELFDVSAEPEPEKLPRIKRPATDVSMAIAVSDEAVERLAMHLHSAEPQSMYSSSWKEMAASSREFWRGAARRAIALGANPSKVPA